MARFQILCLSGGGYKGLYTASVLRQLEEQAQRPIYECFDLIAGTSIGGILALGLANEREAKALEEMLKENGPKIFSGSGVPRSAFVRGLKLFGRFLFYPNRPLYDSKPLAEAIKSEIGAETTIGDLKRAVIVPAVNLSKGKPQVFKTPHHRNFVRDWQYAVTDVALATSAAPTFFPVHEIESELFADGGLYSNAPDHLAYHEATHFFGADPTEIHMLSIGTTTTGLSWSSAFGRELGWFNWAYDQRLINAMMSSQQSNTDAVMRHLLGDRYIRMDSIPSSAQAQQIGLDVASEAATKDLLAQASATVREFASKQSIRELLSYAAPLPKFHYGAR